MPSLRHNLCCLHTVTAVLFLSGCDGIQPDAGPADAGEDLCSLASDDQARSLFADFLPAEFPETSDGNDDGAYVARSMLYGHSADGFDWDAIGVSDEAQVCFTDLRSTPSKFEDGSFVDSLDVLVVEDDDVATVLSGQLDVTDLSDDGWERLLGLSQPVTFAGSSSLVFEVQTLPPTTTQPAAIYAYSLDEGAWRMELVGGFCCSQFHNSPGDTQ